MTAAAVLAEIVDGEAFFVAEHRDSGTVWRQIPAEFIDESDTRELANGYVVAGVEFTNDGTRRAYHIRPQRPTDLYPVIAESIRIPAEDVLHIYRQLGPGQVRGISQLAPILLTVNELDQALDAMLVGLKTSAMFAGFVTDMTNMGGAGEAFPDGLADISLEPGVVRVLPGGTDIKFSAPDQARESIVFAKLTLGQIAAGLGAPQHLVDGDLTQANYSTHGRRAVTVQDGQAINCRQIKRVSGQNFRERPTGVTSLHRSRGGDHGRDGARLRVVGIGPRRGGTHMQIIKEQGGAPSS